MIVYNSCAVAATERERERYEHLNTKMSNDAPPQRYIRGTDAIGRRTTAAAGPPTARPAAEAMRQPEMTEGEVWRKDGGTTEKTTTMTELRTRCRARLGKIQRNTTN